MRRVRKESESTEKRSRSVPLSMEDAEDELISLAYGLTRERLMDGSASNQLIAEVLRMGTTRERLQKEKLERENALLAAKTEAAKSQQRTEAFYHEVKEMLQTYGPMYYGGQQ